MLVALRAAVGCEFLEIGRIWINHVPLLKAAATRCLNNAYILQRIQFCILGSAKTGHSLSVHLSFSDECVDQVGVAIKLVLDQVV